MKKKILNSAVIDAVELSTAQNEYIDNAIGYQLEVISMDNVYNESRGNLVKLLVENVALALTDSPSYTSWNYIHELIKAGICDATGMDEVSFDKNIWAHITSCLEKSYELTKPKSPSVKSEQKSEQRAKIDAMTDAELRAENKLVELAKREEKRAKNAIKELAKTEKDFVKDFKTSMETLAKNEYDFAMWIDTNLNSIREQFLDSQS
jgi:hypothetical protein